MLDERTTEQFDLRGGRTLWAERNVPVRRAPLIEDLRCDVLIVGGGITGSLAAEYLTRLGQHVIVIDRERPGLGSTAASTAMLLWETDSTLTELTNLYGFDRAANIYQRSHRVVAGLMDMIEVLALPCAMRCRDTLYLSAGEVDGAQLLAEQRLRERAGLPGVYLDHRQLADLSIAREGAIHSPGSAEADPLALSRSLLAVAMSRGARVFDAEAVRYDSGPASVIVGMEDGRVIEAKNVVLATGYVMPDFVTSDLHKITSSFAIATPSQPRPLWRGDALIWEASSNYLYARTTSDRRIIVGGEDDPDAVDPGKRDRVMPKKAEAILKRLGALWPDADATAEYVWSGAFGTTADGLPLIGQVSGRRGIYAAYGYGGNGITFSFMAAQILGEMILGRPRAWFDAFALDRDNPVR